MFEKLVESVLEEYVSEWVDGLDSEKMKVALFGGKVEFRDLRLKTSSLSKFQLPLAVKAGTIGRLSLKVPWKRLTKEAVSIHIEDLTLLVVPAHEEELHHQKLAAAAAADNDSDAEDSYALRIRWAKQQEVRVRELLEKNKREDAGAAAAPSSASAATDGSGDTTASWGYREKILHNILDNVSFEFSRIHIRYEDTTQLITKNPLALGVTIDALTVNTTNANGHVAFIDRSQSHTPFVHKTLEMKLAGLYCDDTSSIQDLVSGRRAEPLASSYILHPFNTNVKMTVNHDETTAFSIPKLQFVGDIGSINASVTPDQCNDLISVINFVSTHEVYLKRIHCRRKRPTVPVKRNAKKWWQYALLGVQVMYSLPSRKLSGLSSGSAASSLTRFSNPKPPCDWKLFGALWRYQHEYIRLHKKLLRAAAKKAPVESVVAERCRLNELEDILDVDSIVFFRICAAQELEVEETRHDSSKKLANWKARWHARSHKDESTDSAPGLRLLDPLEKIALYTAINEQMSVSSQVLAQKKLDAKDQTILFAIDVAITSVRVSLVEHAVYDSTAASSTREFLQFELQQLLFAIFQRNGSSSITSSIQSIHMLDFSQRNPDLDNSPKTATALTVKRFLDLKIEASNAKFALDCNFEPFRYIHNLSVAAKLQTYFVAQVDVAPALKENAEDALAYSSEWLNKAVFDGPDAARKNSRVVKRSQSEASLLPKRTFKSGNLLDTFEFAVEGVSLLFYDEASAHENAPTEGSVHESAPLAAKLLRHQGGLKDISEPNRPPRWLVKCMAPPIYFTLSMFKRRKAALKAGTNEKMNTAEALAHMKERLLKKADTSGLEDAAPSEPDPVYDPDTGKPTCKLLEIGPRVRFTLRNADPFTGKIWTQQVVLYWDQDLLVALFRSVDPLGFFGLELHVERWFIFCRPCNTHSKNFALKLYGKCLFGDISTLRTPYLVVKIHAKGGATLESSRVVTESFGISSPDSGDRPPAPIGTGEDVCELLSVNEPVTVTVESAGYGVLAHRTSAAAYVHILGSGVAVNYVNAHFSVFGDYLQNQLISFFNWISVQTQPPNVVLLDERTKIEADISNIRLYVPRGAVGNPVVRQKKPERMEVDIKKVLISSRPHPDCPRMEQLRVEVKDAVAAADVKASRRTLDQLLAASKTTMFCHKAVFVEFAALPIVESAKQKKRRQQREAERGAAARKHSGVKDIDEIAQEMEKLRACVKQLEICGCILNENLGESEVLPRASPVEDAEDEFQALDVQVVIGDVSLSILSSNSIADYKNKSALSPEERAILQVSLRSVAPLNDASDGDGSPSTRATRVLTSCAEMYPSLDAGDLDQCIDVTIDEHAKPSDPNASRVPEDIRVHVENCALTPFAAHLASRIEPFLFGKSKMQFYSPSPAAPVNVSHVQVFGRKLSFEIAAQWPPQQNVASAIAAIPPPSPSPTRPPIPHKQHRGSFASQRPSSSELVSLASYRRVLCDDFAIDVDLVDTMNSESLLKFSASLTHFHCVLCTFDVFMISQIATFDFADARPQQRDGADIAKPDEDVNAVATAAIEAPGCNAEIVVNTILEDASVTFVREIGEYFTPVARLHTYCAMCKDSASELREDEGLSVWGFNTLLGSWEPLVEPWTFALGVTLLNDRAGKVVTSVDLSGSDVHALSLNCSPSLLDALCTIAKEMELLFGDSRVLRVSTASIISCGFYLANDCGAEISYWVSDNGAAAPTSRGFSYAPRQKRAPEQLLPRHKVPLKLSTALFNSLPADQTVSFSWGDDAWHPLTDVRIHSAGKYVYSVLPRSTALAAATNAVKTQQDKPLAAPPVLLALFDISSVFGYRTLTVSSLVRVFNETDITIDCGILGEDGKSVIEIGTIEPHDACGVPITLVKTIAAIRVLVKPHRSTTASPAPTIQGRRDSRSPPTSAPVASGADAREHRWSNELFITEKEDCTEHYAACSLILGDYDCKCQRMFDGSQPLHVSQICRSNGSFFRVWNRTFAASNASSLRYAQMRVLPPLAFENKCGVALFVVVFVFKKVRRAGAQDREYFHLVASEKIPPRRSMQFLASSLHENTYCAVSMTGFSWSKLFLLPAVFPQPLSASASTSNSNDSSRAGAGGRLPPTSLTGASSNPASPSSSSHSDGSEVLCTLADFRARQATINVAFVSSSHELNAMRKVILQPRFVIHNDTPLPLVFEPRAKVKSNLSTAKTFFGIRTPAKKQHVACCGGATANTQEEMELFYCSESNFLDVQIEGNSAPSSGVQQFRLDAAMGGANSSLRLFDESKKMWCDLVVILEQMDAYTTKVTFVERYLVLNRTPHAIMCMPAVDIVVSSNHSHDAKPTHSPTHACVRLKLQGAGDGHVAGWRWSGKFSLHEVSETALKLSNKYANQVHVLRVEIRVESSVRVYVVLTSEDTAPFPLYRVINSTANEMIHFKQCFDGGSGELAEQSAAAADFNRGVTQRLLPGESICLGWDEAYFLQSLERVLVISYSSETTRSKVLLDQPGEAQRVDISASKAKAAYQVYLHWYLNGVTKTVHLHDTELPRDKLTGKQNAPPSVSERTGSSGGVLQLAATLVSELNLNLKLPSILVSVLNSKPEEVLLFSGEKLELAYAKTVGVHDQCEVKIGSFQLDNQLDNAVFPVIFTPIPSNAFSSIGFMDSPRKSARPMTPPTLQERKRSNADECGDDVDDVDQFLHVSIFRLSYGDDVEYIKYLSAMLQPARVQIDDFLIISVGSLVTDCMQVVLHHFPDAENEHRAAGAEAPGLNATAERTLAATSDHDDTLIAKVPPVERRMYIETLQLHPVRVHITFQQNNLSSATFFDDQDAILLPMVFMILKSNLVNIDSASLNLNALHIYHSFTTRAFMASTIQQHYAFQGILQIYALVGAADILGNPIGLVTNLGTGVKDFFYEPVAGMVKSPQEFVLGLSRGTASLVKNSVYGTFNAASKFTGTLSSGIAALSMDSKYINERNSRNRHEVPTHLGTGLLYGTKQLGQGILAGVSGVITAPAMGAYTNGLSGFVEGVGKGLIGVAVKPTAGILDLAARTTAGITATATVFDRKARSTRVRLPRMMHTSDKRLRVYSGDEAMISQLLHKLPQRLLQNEHYEAHVFLPLSRAVVATSHQFLHVDFSSSGAAAAVAMGPAPPRITWKCPLTSVWGAQKTGRGVSIMIGTATNVQVSPAMNTLVTKSSMSTVLIPLRDTETQFADRVIKCVSDLVARQRQRATPESETYAAPPPRNSIGLVLEPVRAGERVPAGYEGSGGQVVDVFVGSACFRAGVEVGDVIVGFGGKKFERGDHGSALRYQLSLMKKGDTLELMVVRSGEMRTIRVATE
ncbi:hypothetical protein PybrP1_006768 [[Pythium] brassicae (nom. inval.)]|nr:hypothetical protein PybrP1_006768 [[Pythium] brassicae (nom. inval.)]